MPASDARWLGGAGFLDVEAGRLAARRAAWFRVDGEGRLSDFAEALPERALEPTPVALEAGEVAVWLPGFVNPHAHLDLTRLAGRTAPTRHFIAWLGQVRAHREELRAQGAVAEAVREGLALSLAGGVTAVGDIATERDGVAALFEGPLPAVAYCEAIGPSAAVVEERMTAVEELLARGREAVARAVPRSTVGLSPHAPYSVADGMFARLRELPEARGPVAIHVAETREEIALLTRGEGPMWQLFGMLGLLDDTNRCYGEGPIARLERLGWLPARRGIEPGELGLAERLRQPPAAAPPRTLLVHGNYLSEEEIARLGEREVAVCWCAETHAFFGHAPYPVERLQGLPLVLGADSLASAWSLSPLAQVRRALEVAPGWSVTEALLAITLRARDAVFGRDGGAPWGDFTVLAVPGERWRRVAESADDEAMEAAGRALLRDPAVRPVATVVAGEAVWRVS